MREIHERRSEWACPLARVSPDIARARLLFRSLTVGGHSSFTLIEQKSQVLSTKKINSTDPKIMFFSKYDISPMEGEKVNKQ